MGYTTAILIRNDGLDQIRKNPEEFTQKLVDEIDLGMHRRIAGEDYCEIGCGNHANVAQVMPSRHADEHVLYEMHGNLLVERTVPHRGGVVAALREARRKAGPGEFDVADVMDVLDDLGILC